MCRTDLRLKEKALVKMETKTKVAKRFRPDDKLLAFLESL